MLPTETNQIKQFESYTNGVTVEKTLSISDDDIGVVGITIDSTHDEQITVQVTDRLPTGFDTDRIGFRPDDRERWITSDESVTFETSVSETESVETLYGINDTDKPELRRFVGNPEVTIEFDGEVVGDSVLSDEPVEASQDTSTPATPDDANTSSDSILNDTSVETVLADEPVESSDDSTAQEPIDPEPSERSFLMDDTEAAESTAETPTDSEEAVSETTAATEAPVEPRSPSVELDLGAESHDVVATLVAELEQGNLTEHERSVLVEHFGHSEGDTDAPVNGSVVARLRHVETTVNDLEAYTAALESFLDETGDAQELLTEVEETREALSTVQADLTSVKTSLQSMADRLDGFETVSETVDRLDEQMNEVEPTVATLRDHHEAMGDRITDLESEMESLQTVVTANRSFRESVETAVTKGEASDHLSDADSAE
ncbi:hypothetical protein [Haladaptatus sp. NG-SE-30]